jgi:hypothetical protein
MSQGGSPSQEVARGLIRFEADMTAVDDAMRDADEKVRAKLAEWKALIDSLFDSVPERAQQAIVAIQAVRDAAQEAEQQRTPEARSEPQQAANEQPTERGVPDEVLVKLTELQTTVTNIEDNTAEANELLRVISERELP